jgi:hypothetical protein
MTSEQAFRIAGRCLAIYFLFWIVNDAIALPREFVSLSHYWQELHSPRHPTPTSSEDPDVYLLRSFILSTSENVLKIALWSLAALWLYRGDRRVQRLLGLVDPG